MSTGNVTSASCARSPGNPPSDWIRAATPESPNPRAGDRRPHGQGTERQAVQTESVGVDAAGQWAHGVVVGCAEGGDEEPHVVGLRRQVGNALVEGLRVADGELVAGHRESGHRHHISGIGPVTGQGGEQIRVTVEPVGQDDQRSGTVRRRQVHGGRQLAPRRAGDVADRRGGSRLVDEIEVDDSHTHADRR